MQHPDAKSNLKKLPKGKAASNGPRLPSVAASSQRNYSIKLGALRDEGWTYKLKNFELTDEEFLAQIS